MVGAKNPRGPLSHKCRNPCSAPSSSVGRENFGILEAQNTGNSTQMSTGSPTHTRKNVIEQKMAPLRHLERFLFFVLFRPIFIYILLKCALRVVCRAPEAVAMLARAHALDTLMPNPIDLCSWVALRSRPTPHLSSNSPPRGASDFGSFGGVKNNKSLAEMHAQFS